MKTQTVAGTVAVTTFAFTPSYINPIAPVKTIQFDTNQISSTKINLIDLKSDEIKRFVKKIYNDSLLSINVTKYIDDIDNTYVSIFSKSIPIDKLFDIEEQLNKAANEKGEKYIFTVGE